MWRADSLKKNPDAGKDWKQEEKGTTEDEMVGCYHQLNGHEFEQTPGGGEGQESLHAAIHGVLRVRNDWVIQRQQQLRLFTTHRITLMKNLKEAL